MRIASGLAMTRSKLSSPALTLAARSSSPTMSAPASRAASAFLPEVNTATRTVLPVPCGMTVEPRTCWSDLLASMPRFTEASTDSGNFALANSLTSASASSIGYCLPGTSFAFQAFTRLATAGMSDPLHVDARAAGAARDRAHRRVQIGRGEVRHLELGDLFELLAGDFSDFRRIGRAAAFFNPQRLAQEHRSGRCLQDEGEAAITVDRDHHRNRQPLLQLLSLRVERLAELHDVDALLAERGPHGRARIRLPCRDLQLDVAGNFLSHVSPVAGPNAVRLPVTLSRPD